ncbi:MAG: hypothetical protein Q4E65_09540 [Clostridia bacterium]|nr:hypothetical protein [Clostridia bacterium]
MEKLKRTSGKIDLIEGFGMALFAACAVVFLYVAVAIVPVLTESDAASDIVQAQLSPFWSGDWYFANGVNMFNFQWLRALLLRFISDWGTVRGILFVVTVGCTQLTMHYLLRQLGLGRREFWYGAALLFLFYMLNPNEKQQYTTILSYGFFAPALLLRALGGGAKDKGGRLAGAVFLLLALLSGVCGTHLLLSLYLPLLLAALVLLFIEAKDAPASGYLAAFKRFDYRAALLLFAGVVLAAGGYLLSRRLLWPQLHVEMATGVQGLFFTRPTGADLWDVIMRYFTVFNYAEGNKATSFIGLGNFCALGLGVLCPVLTVLTARRAAKAGTGRDKNILLLCLGCGMLLLAAVFPMLFTTIARAGRYYLPGVAYFAVVFAAYAGGCTPSRLRQSCVALVMCGMLGLALLSGWHNSNKAVRLTDRTAQTEALAFLTENGYTQGYAPYWHASVNTERMDGRLLLSPVHVFEQEDGALHVVAFRWLTPCHGFDADHMKNNGPLILLLPTAQAHPLDQWNPDYDVLRAALDAGGAPLPGCTKVFENAAYTIYTLPDGAYFDADGTLRSGAAQ